MRHNRHLFAISTNIAKRFFCDAAKKEKKHSIAVVGAAGGCGQPLSLLLKLNPSIGELRLHDIQNIAGVAMDLSHIETASKVLHSSGTEYCEALKGGVDIIVLVAGNPRKPDQKREDLFNINAPFAFKFAEAVAKHSPDAILLIISNPVNSIVPLICEVLKNQKKFCPGKVLGVTTLDSVRAATFISELTCMDPKDVTVPVIGGHSVHTIIPLISKTNPKVCIEGEKLCKLVKRIQESGTEIVKAKEGKSSSSLSTAYAASRLIFALLRALNGESNIVESAYVMSDVHPDVKYFATPLILGKNGVEKNLGIGTALSDYEQKMLCEAITHLKKEIEVGESFAKAEICNKGKNKVPIPVPAAPAAAAVTGKK